VNTTLKRLDLSGRRSPGAYRWLAAKKGIVSWVVEPNVGDSAPEILRALRQNSSLTSLSLAWNLKIRSDDCAGIVHGNATLRALDVRGNWTMAAELKRAQAEGEDCTCSREIALTVLAHGGSVCLGAARARQGTSSDPSQGLAHYDSIV
jgi:hypothetical protein